MNILKIWKTVSCLLASWEIWPAVFVIWAGEGPATAAVQSFWKSGLLFLLISYIVIPKLCVGLKSKSTHFTRKLQLVKAHQEGHSWFITRKGQNAWKVSHTFYPWIRPLRDPIAHSILGLITLWIPLQIFLGKLKKIKPIFFVNI